MTPPRTLRAAVACMRNEGMFLPEWVAYHLTIGFDRLFLVTNDCHDGTDRMADRLAELEPLNHVRNPVEPGQSPQITGMARALQHPAMAEVEWLLHIDADEFLNVTAGAGRVEDLLAVTGDCDTIAIAWRFIASGGRKSWTGGSLIAEQTLTAATIAEDIPGHKSLFRPNRFARATDHMPKDPLSPDVTARNTRGTPIPTKALHHPTTPRYRGLAEADRTWDNADIHHYFVRAEDVFLLKNIRGDGMARTHDNYHLGSTLHTRAERGTTPDTSIQRHLPGVQARFARYAADPVLAALASEASAWFQGQCDRFLTPQNRSAWDKRAPKGTAT